MTPTLRPETPADRDAIRALTARAFAPMPFADGNDQHIPGRLRDVGALTLSTVAEVEGTLVGHIALSPATVGGAAGWLALGPISVAPERQRQGIGAALMRHAIDHARAQGAPGLVLVGDPAYYGRFGFASHPGVTWRDLPPHLVMALPLGGTPARGEVAFHPAFG